MHTVMGRDHSIVSRDVRPRIASNAVSMWLFSGCFCVLWMMSACSWHGLYREMARSTIMRLASSLFWGSGAEWLIQLARSCYERYEMRASSKRCSKGSIFVKCFWVLMLHIGALLSTQFFWFFASPRKLVLDLFNALLRSPFLDVSLLSL